MNYEIERKILNNMLLTNDEVNKFLSFFCKFIRENCQIFDPMDTDCKMCYDTSQMFGRIAAMKFGCDVEILDIKKLLQIPLTHYANFISFYVGDLRKIYLVDMTYSQFFGDTITLDGDKESGEVISTKKIFGKIEDEKFVQELRENGFIELNENILKKYVDTFLDLCNVQNKEGAYANINGLLMKNEMNYTLKK